MGNTSSFDALVDHPRYSKAAFAKDSLAMIVKEPLLSRARILQPWIQSSKLYSHIYSNQDIARPVSHMVEMVGRCSDSCIWVGRYDDKYVSTLKQQIAKRHTKNEFFTEEEVWHLLLVLSRCASEVYSYGQKHFLGNIHPYNILINRKDEYKILVTSFSMSLPGSLNHFEEYRIHGDSQAFISPQILGFLANKKYPDYPDYPRCVDKQTAEAFSLGMTLLSMCTLQNQFMKVFKVQNVQINSQSLQRLKQNNWDIKKSLHSHNSLLLSSVFQDEEITNSSVTSTKNKLGFLQLINSEFLDSLLHKTKEKYTQTLFEIIMCLVHPQTQKRMRIDRLYNEYLKPIEKQIEAFNINWLIQIQSKNKDHGFGASLPVA